MPLSAAQRWLHTHAITLIAVALILTMSISLAWQTAGWLRALRAPVPAAEQNVQLQASVASRQNLDQLFGSSSQADDGPVPATQLNMTLLGSFVHADPARSSAIIRREGSEPQRYGVDSEIANGVRLSAVYPDHVELLRNGKRESLTFPQHHQGSGEQTMYTPSYDAQSSVDELNQLEADNLAQLRERMDALRQQMEASGTEPTEEEPTDQTDQTMESD
nr:type II secretion system protein N [uncultured Pseudomonas sp.]